VERLVGGNNLNYKVRRWMNNTTAKPLRDIIMIDSHTKITLVYASLLSKKLPLRICNVNKPLYFGSQGFIVFFDKSDSKGFLNIDKAFADGINLLQDNYSCCLYGLITNNDLISTEEGLKKSKELGIPYFETKADRSMIELIRNIASEWEDIYMDNWLAKMRKRFKIKTDTVSDEIKEKILFKKEKVENLSQKNISETLMSSNRVHKKQIFSPPSSTIHNLAKGERRSFYCQLDNMQHPKTTSAFQCLKCSRQVCESCHLTSTAVGISTCPFCNGELRKIQ